MLSRASGGALATGGGLTTEGFALSMNLTNSSGGGRISRTPRRDFFRGMCSSRSSSTTCLDPARLLTPPL